MEIHKEDIDSAQKRVQYEMNQNDNRGQQIIRRSAQDDIRTVNGAEKRSRNLMIHGCEEKEIETYQDLVDIVDDVYRNAGQLPTSSTVAIYRVGKNTTGKVRPIRVEMKNSDDVQFILMHASKLKVSDMQSVYLQPDRTRKERAALRKLVTKMKQMNNIDSSKHYFIRNGKISWASEQQTRLSMEEDIIDQPEHVQVQNEANLPGTSKSKEDWNSEPENREATSINSAKEVEEK